MVCGKGGPVMCCEKCRNVIHVECTRLKKEPKGEWYCRKCYDKMAKNSSNNRTQRNVVAQIRNDCGY